MELLARLLAVADLVLALVAAGLDMLDCITELCALDDSMLLGWVGLLVALLWLLDCSPVGAPPHADNKAERSTGTVIAASFFKCVYINKHLLKNYIVLFGLRQISTPEAFMFSTFWCK